MKKLLSILAAVGLTATASTAVVACTTTEKYTVKANETGFTRDFDVELNKANNYWATNVKLGNDLAAKLSDADQKAAKDNGTKSNDAAETIAKKVDFSKIAAADLEKITDQVILPVYSDGTNMSVNANDLLAKHTDKKGFTITVKMVTMSEMIKVAKAKDSTGNADLKSSSFMYLYYQLADSTNGQKAKWVLRFYDAVPTLTADEKAPVTFFNGYTKDQLKDAFNGGNKEAKIKVSFAK